MSQYEVQGIRASTCEILKALITMTQLNLGKYTKCVRYIRSLTLFVSLILWISLSSPFSRCENRAIRKTTSGNKSSFQLTVVEIGHVFSLVQGSHSFRPNNNPAFPLSISTPLDGIENREHTERSLCGQELERTWKTQQFAVSEQGHLFRW